jgi:hypothetical protein
VFWVLFFGLLLRGVLVLLGLVWLGARLGLLVWWLGFLILVLGSMF